MPSGSYRYYRLNGIHRFSEPSWFEAANDQDAKSQVETKHPDARLEIWQGPRLVAKVFPKHYDADDPDLQNAVGDRLSALALIIRSDQEHRG